MSYLPLHSNLSHKKISTPRNSEPGSSSKKPFLIKQFTNVKSPTNKRQSSPPFTERQKSVPSNIIYDKETLYMQVQQLKKLINKLTNDNNKLKTRITVLQTQKDRLHSSQQYEDIEEKQLYRAYLIENSNRVKKDNLKSEALKKQVKQLQLQLELQKKENARIKKTIKYSKINQLQIQLKTFLEENKYLYRMYQQMKSKVKNQGSQLEQTERLQSKIKKLTKQNKNYITQRQNLYLEILNLQAQLQKQKANKKNSKESSVKNEFSAEKRVAGIKLRQLMEFRRENSLVDHQIRSMRAKEKLKQTSFKSYHVHIQPIRKNHIFGSQVLQKLDYKRGSSFQLQQQKVELRNENEKLKSEISLKERKLKQIEATTAKISNKIQSKPSAVPTFFSQNLDKDEIIKQQHSTFVHKQKKRQANQPQAQLYKQEHKNVIKNGKTNGFLKKSQSQRNFGDDKEKEKEDTDDKKMKTQYWKQVVDLQNLPHSNYDQGILREIQQILNYRFIYQKYRFSDLKNDIESSNAKSFSYIDLCHMLVNEPFYLNLDYCRVLTSFIFEKQKPTHEQTVEMRQLLMKLREIIKDYQQMTIQKQFSLLQKCGQLVKKHKKSLVQQLQAHKNQMKTIEILKLREILSNYEFGGQEIDYMIAQVSVSSNDLQNIPYELMLQRFSIAQSLKSSKQSIIFQKGEEQNSNLNYSQKSLINKSIQNVKNQEIHQTDEKRINSKEMGNFKKTQSFQEEPKQQAKKDVVSEAQTALKS